MADYYLSCCSTADLTKEQLQDRGIKYVCFHYELDGKQYMDDLGETMSFKTFYDEMAKGAMTKTSQVNFEEYTNYFKAMLDEGKDILHLTLSSGISGTYNSAALAASELQEAYPDRKIYIIDSLTASAGYGLFMDKLADLRDEGLDIEALKTYALENRTKQQAWFFTTDLTYLIRGGRVSKAAGAIGSILNICPLLYVNREGRLLSFAKVRTKKKVFKAILEQMENRADNGTAYADKVFISHADCYEDARAVADLIEETFPNMKGKVVVNYIGTTIGSHTGPGTVALFFWGGEKEL